MTVAYPPIPSEIVALRKIDPREYARQRAAFRRKHNPDLVNEQYRRRKEQLAAIRARRDDHLGTETAP